MTSDAISAAYEAPYAAARAWKSGGGQVVGYLGNTAPVELIEAAGAFPVMLTGLPGQTTPMADQFMEDLFDPIVRGVFEQVLRGDLQFLDAIVLPRSNDSIQRLYYYLCELRRRGGQAPLPLLLDLQHTASQAAADYSLARMGELKAELEGLCGHTITETSLGEAMARFETGRARMAAFGAARPSRGLAGSEALKAYTAWRVMPPGAFDAALLALETGGVAPKGPKVVLAGSAQDTPDLHRLIEAAGGHVVGDYHPLGDLLVGSAAPSGLPPLEALTRRYQFGLMSSRTFPRPPGALADFARARDADVVIFHFWKVEEALTWDYPAERRALAAAGVSALAFTDQPYGVDPALGRRIAETLGAIA
ncbi:MAG: 2-hydroxyacyl-CoA dehydratase family protein [Caulobacteraceae bacterium]